MVFEQFLKDLRQLKGLTQLELSNLISVSEKTLSGYETGRRQCNFNYGMEILDKLNVSILVENNSIKLVKGDVNMTKEYTNGDLDFINFDTNEYIRKAKELRTTNVESAKENFKKAYKKLDLLGFETILGFNFSEKYWMDEFYDDDTKLASFKKDGKEISLIVSGYFDINMFIVERFIEKIEEVSDKNVADFILKCILYYNATSGYGNDIYNSFKRKDILAINNTLPMAKNYSQLIKDVLNDNYDYFFVDIANGYDPFEISISNELEFYDCSSTPNLYFTYTMEDGAEVIDYEASFEGHDISDAFNYVEEYFNDYDDYVAAYNSITKEDDSECDEDTESMREIVILN